VSERNLPEHFVYSPLVIEFTTVAAEVCRFLEYGDGYGMRIFVDKALKFLPLLYLKAQMIDIPERLSDFEPERFVTEDDYVFVKQKTAQWLGTNDVYLEVFHPDMERSDTPVVAFISENLADIYQEIKDFVSNYQTLDTDVMNDSLALCLEGFAEHWGQKLLNALRALHCLRYGDDFCATDDGIGDKKKGTNI
jgi:hypothetical protein